MLYSRGFASIYGEWETTAEVKTTQRTFHESMRLPWPSAPVTVTLKKRQRTTRFKRRVVGGRRPGVAVRQPGGAAGARRAGVDGDGERPGVAEGRPADHRRGLHARAELPKFHGDVKRLLGALFAQEPFKSRKTGLQRPRARPAGGAERHQPAERRRLPADAVSAEYNVFDSERYVLTLDNRALRDAASAAPYEFIEILVNDKTYGGGGIFNDQATASVDSAFSDYVFVHEFGHHFAALADEYYTSDVAYETGADATYRSRGSRTSPR